MTEPLDLSLFAKPAGDGTLGMELAVEGIACGACIARIEGAVKRLPGVTEARLNFTNRRLHVAWADGAIVPAQILQTLESIGYHGYPFAPLRAEQEEAAEMRRLLRCLAVAGFAAMNIMLLSVSVWSGNATDITPETRDFFHWASALIALPAAAYAGRPFFSSAWRALRARSLNMDVPISLGVILALTMSVIETAHHATHAYYDSAIMLLFFLLVGRTLDHAMRRKTRAVAGNLAALKAETAHRFMGDELVGVPVAALHAGDRLLVRPGERVPADGVVLGGVSEIDDSLITGETARRKAEAGATVYAGSMNYSGALTLRVTAADRATLLDEIERLLEKAASAKSHTMRLADRAARFYAPMVHTTAALTLARLVAGGRVHARRGGDGHRRAHHHLPLRAGAGDTGGAGGGVGRLVPRRRDPERGRRHRAAGRSRHRHLRQDRHAHAAGAARRQCRRDRSRFAANGRAAGAVEPASAGGSVGARSHKPRAL